MSTRGPTHYELLSIPPTADIATIKTGYKKIALANNPDKTLHLPESEISQRIKVFKQATAAYEPPSPPPPRPNPNPIHRFTTGRPQPPTNEPWYYAPVTETDSHTVLEFSNSQGWYLSISVSKKYAWTACPVVLSVQQDTRAELNIKLDMRRTGQALASPFEKEITVRITRTPGSRQTALSSLFTETRHPNSKIELSITLATNSTPSPTSLPMQAFDPDFGFLAPFFKEVRATHKMFYPTYPAHAVGADGGVPGPEFPVGSPARALRDKWPGMYLVTLSRGFYCTAVEGKRGEKGGWRVVAVGFV
ncbi:hypothetical protein BDW02DRAFT_507031 [Decorospora gaudefroyi]|uniref:J domain-containing protein n=1 Tax=Decorospora gaudefroyi TaxID=184978 RepID=A0A6A5K1M3_9PLEO|nr:hypothetical protein BDW02DRAFT_507031 [Decorospora gaudefroyi]